MAKVVQFAHPGGEHKPSDGPSGNYIDWNTGDHLRKFIETDGTWLDGSNIKRNGKLWFWTEWKR